MAAAAAVPVAVPVAAGVVTVAAVVSVLGEATRWAGGAGGGGGGSLGTSTSGAGTGADGKCFARSDKRVAVMARMRMRISGVAFCMGTSVPKGQPVWQR